MKRSDMTTVVKTGFERIPNSTDHRFCIWTSDFVRPFSRWGTYGYPLEAHYHQAERCDPKVGDRIRMGRLAGVPVTNWHWLANIASGCNILIGSVSDGLVRECGPLYVCKAIDFNQGYDGNPAGSPRITDEMMAVARRAVLTGNKELARRVLVESGPFKDVYEFESGLGYTLDDCFEPDDATEPAA